MYFVWIQYSFFLLFKQNAEKYKENFFVKLGTFGIPQFKTSYFPNDANSVILLLFFLNI